MTGPLKVGLTRDILDSRGEPAFGVAALAILDGAPGIEWEYLPEIVGEISADHAARYDALYVNLPRVPAAAVARADCRLRVVARHGVGYDSVDVAAMTRAGIIVTHTPSSMPRPVATIALSFVLALAGRLMLKDRLTRTGRWHERMDNMGMGLTGRTLGVVGAGRIGKELLRMARAFDLKLLAADPYVNAIELGYIGARKVGLDTLLAESDFVVVCCLLNDETRHLIGAPQFARMRPTAYFVNVARGPIVDEAALIEALRAGRIGGAALDVFEQEPVAPDNPLLAMDHVIVTPHSLCWTDECFHNMASTGLASIVDALAGRRPEFVVNPEVARASARARLVPALIARRRGSAATRYLSSPTMSAPCGGTNRNCAASCAEFRSNGPNVSVVTLPKVSLSSITRGRLLAKPMRTRSNPVSDVRGFASTKSTPSRVPASVRSKLASSALSPARSAAGVEPSARSSLRTIT